MDNITHSIIATALGTVVLRNKSIEKNVIRVALVSSLIAFIPDMDVVLRIVSKTLYAQEHRGFTHSIFGMLFIVPIGAYISKYLFRNTLRLATKDSYIYSFVIWFFGHIIPDFFTIYGVQIFYLFDYTHYDYALMFIIDMAVWIMGIVYLIVYFKKVHLMVRSSKIFLMLLGILMSIYAGIRYDYVTLFEQKYPTATDIKYTPIMHVFLARNIFANSDNGYIQNVISSVDELFALGKIFNESTYPYMPKEYVQNKLPNNGVYSSESKYLFSRFFQAFGRAVVCVPIKTGAKCMSLKYKYPSVKLYERSSNVLERIIPF